MVSTVRTSTSTNRNCGPSAAWQPSSVTSRPPHLWRMIAIWQIVVLGVPERRSNAQTGSPHLPESGTLRASVTSTDSIAADKIRLASSISMAFGFLLVDNIQADLSADRPLARGPPQLQGRALCELVGLHAVSPVLGSFRMEPGQVGSE